VWQGHGEQLTGATVAHPMWIDPAVERFANSFDLANGLAAGCGSPGPGGATQGAAGLGRAHMQTGGTAMLDPWGAAAGGRAGWQSSGAAFAYGIGWEGGTAAHGRRLAAEPRESVPEGDVVVDE
jgi:hypothetical protein